jgi:hypothetical protein
MLRTGILRIANYLANREGEWAQKNPGISGFVFGRDIDGTDGAPDFIACLFHWFGVSVCNYARLVGFVRGLSRNEFTRAALGDSTSCDIVRKCVDDYVNGIADLADVLLWRNKVGAHFAITSPRPKDNISTLDMSVMYPVAFSDGRYYVNPFTMTRSSARGTFTSEIPRWSVTEVFEKLIPRYWPNLTKKSDKSDSAADNAPSGV